MVVGHHLIWTAYGCWLPNDPRGSSSQELREDKLGPLGDVHPGRKRIQPPGKDIRDFYQLADALLAHQRQLLSAEDVTIAAAGFTQAIHARTYTCYACAIMPDHVHILIRRHRDKGEEMIGNLQSASRLALIAAGRRPANHPVWGGPGWKVFLNSRADIERIISYIRNNPLKAGMPEQHWDFVTKYDGWLPGPGWRKS